MNEIREDLKQQLALAKDGTMWDGHYVRPLIEWIIALEAESSEAKESQVGARQVNNMRKPQRWDEILYFHQHPEEHPDTDYVCDGGEESEVVLYAAGLEAERDELKEQLDELKGIAEGLADVIAGRTKPLAQIESELASCPASAQLMRNKKGN